MPPLVEIDYWDEDNSKAESTEIVHLEQESSGTTWTGSAHVPRTAAGFAIMLADESDFIRYPITIIPAQRKDGQAAQNAEILRMEAATPERYKQHFENELRRYPENISAYVAKWQYEQRNGLNAAESIRREIRQIEQAHSNNPALPGVQACAYAMLGNRKKYGEAMQALTEKPCPAVFNDRTLSSAITGMLGLLNTGETQRRIIELNPTTEYSINRSTDGTIQRLPPATANAVLTAMLEAEPLPINKFMKASHLLEHYGADSLRKAESLAKAAFTALRDPLRFVKGLDPEHTLYLWRLDVYGLMAEIEHRKGNTARAIELVEEGRATLEPTDTRQALAWLFVGKYLQAQGNNGAALRAYAQAERIEPSFTEPRDSLKRYYERQTGQKPPFAAWLAALQAEQQEAGQQIGKDCPPVRLANGRTVNLAAPGGKAAVLEFYSTSCAACSENIKALSRYKEQAGTAAETPQLIAISDEAPEQQAEYLAANGYRLQRAVNGAELMQYFRITGLPVTLLINSRGQLVRRMAGGKAAQDFTASIKALD